jgi:hypothetical protein
VASGEYAGANAAPAPRGGGATSKGASGAGLRNLHESHESYTLRRNGRIELISRQRALVPNAEALSRRARVQCARARRAAGQCARARGSARPCDSWKPTHAVLFTRQSCSQSEPNEPRKTKNKPQFSLIQEGI